VSFAVTAPPSPYKGLAPFEDSDADALLFFGRERESEVIAANLIASRITVLYGPSGVGKSSVLRAGVAHRLRKERDAAVIVFADWIGDPVAALVEAAGGTGDSLADALADAADRAGGDLYLILDQFEECFLYHRDGGRFAQQLAEVLRRTGLRVNVLLGMREDALARLDALKGAIPNLLANRLRLERLDRAAGAAAIVGPIKRYNELAPADERVEMEPALQEAILDEVTAGRVELGLAGRGVSLSEDDDGRIEAPYLQLVLERLWEVERSRGSRRLRVATLRELGGAGHIVEDHLERAMAELSPREKGAAAAMYNFLVTPSGTKIAHGVGDLAGYASVDEGEAEQVLRRLTAERIVRASSTNGPSSTRYEIFHDVLADAVLAWRTRYAAEGALHEAERRRRRALLVATAALAGLLLVAGIAVFALLERSHSQADARRARAGRLAANATIQLRVDPQQSLRYALAAARLHPGTEEETVLRNALIAARLRRVLPAGAPVAVAGFSPDGRWLVTGAKNGKGRIYDARTLRVAHILDQHGSVQGAAFDERSRRLLTAGRDGFARLWTVDGRLVRVFPAGGPAQTALLDPTGKVIVTTSTNGLVRVFRLRSTGVLRQFVTRGKAIPNLAAIDPSARLLVTAAHDRFARVYALRSGRLLRTLAQKGFIRSVAFSPDGKLILTSGYEGRARLWDARNGRLVHELRGPDRSALSDAIFSPDGSHVAAAGNDGTVRVWETATGYPIGIAVGHLYEATHVAFDPSGKYVISGDIGGTAKVWSTEGRLTSLLSGHRGQITAVAFSPDGNSAVTASDDGTARIWNPWKEDGPELKVAATVAKPYAVAVGRNGREVSVGDGSSLHVYRVTRAGLRRGPTLQGTIGRRTVAISPDGRLKAVGHADGRIELLDAHSGNTLHRLVGHTRAITSLEFSPDGRLLLSASKDKDARLWSAETGKLVHLLRWHFGPVASATFSPDGRWVLTAGPGSAGLGDVATGERIVFLRGHTKPLVGAVFAGRDGRLIVTASKDGTVRTWRCGLCGDVHDLIKLAQQRLSGR
jgi:WD40 repeat protein